MATPELSTPQMPQIPKEIQDAAGKAAGAVLEGAKQKALDTINPKNAVSTVDAFMTGNPIFGWAARIIPQQQRLDMIASTGSLLEPVWNMVKPVVQPLVDRVSAMIPQGVKDMFVPQQVAQAPTETPVKPEAVPNAPAKVAAHDPVSPSPLPTTIKTPEKGKTK
jgi:hypothetical protein